MLEILRQTELDIAKPKAVSIHNGGIQPDVDLYFSFGGNGNGDRLAVNLMDYERP